ncbi:PilW family protein [Kineobactrum salinum]|uniref:Prepilin-type N-terminal cleavage/methylation domain-containing protein n=1 Tax=Kineobactrum salinum TaxID=2708301 RepID=A0A6C0U4K0_9GAMM|nr:PilW family protein [Kineobactrum salinum]QIB66349.1 hypothetical protein G3T16_13990 [Kineobactrum salinum]
MSTICPSFPGAALAGSQGCGTGCAGLSLVELLVSIVLGLMLSAGIVAVYLDSKSNYLVEEEMARIQENGRFALNLLKRELALAGFFGGNPGIAGFSPAASAPDCGTAADWPLQPSTPLDILDDYAGGAIQMSSGVRLDCVTAGDLQVAVDSDVLAVKRSAGEATLRDGVYRAGVTAARNNQWYLRFADNGAEVSWWRQGTAPASIPAVEVNAGGGTGIDYWAAYANIFYVRSYSVDAGDNIPSLCAERLSGSGMLTRCLIEGVESLQVEFGIDSSGDGVPNQYRTTPTAAELSRVVTARIYLLVRGLTPVTGYTNSKHYQLGQTAIAARHDGYLRRVFSTTVQTHNALLPVI